MEDTDILITNHKRIDDIIKNIAVTGTTHTKKLSDNRLRFFVISERLCIMISISKPGITSLKLESGDIATKSCLITQ